MARLGDICTLVNGYAFKPTDWKTEGLPIIRIQNLNDTTAPFNYFNGEIDRKYVVNDGDLLFSWSGTPGTSFGAFFWRRGKGVLNQHIFNVYPVDGINKAYLRYALNGNISRIIDKAHGGVGLQHITKKELVEIDIPILSEEQQNQIVIVLDSVDKLIALRKEQLAKLDQLVKSRFIELSKEWGYEATPLQEFLDDITYGFTNPMPDAEEGPWKITAKDVVNGRINFGTARKTTLQAYEELTAKSKPDIGTVLLTKDGTLGRCAVVEEDGLCVNQSVAVLKCNKRILPKFLAILLQMPEYQREMLKNAGGGTIKHIYITKVVDMMVMVPDVSQQLEFLSFVEQTDKSKLAIQQSLDKLELLKKSLMQEYFG